MLESESAGKNKYKMMKRMQLSMMMKMTGMKEKILKVIILMLTVIITWIAMMMKIQLMYPTRKKKRRVR